MEITLIYRSKLIINTYENWISSQSCVLDIGCGNGVVTNQLQKHFKCSIKGTDILDYCKKEIPFTIMKKEDELPFRDKEFDIAMLNDVLPHCNNWQGILKEAQRVASRVLIFVVEPSFLVKIWDIVIDKIYHPDMNLAINIKTAEEWKVLFRDLDFEVRKAKTSFWYPFRHFAFKIVSTK